MTTLLILGAGGDLTHRLLLPGLASLLQVERDRKVTVIGADRADLTAEQWRDRLRDAFASVGTPDEVISPIAESSRYVNADLLDGDSMSSLLADVEPPLVLYFALPPAVSSKVCELLAGLDLPHPTRLALEKPFGTDQASARAFNHQLHEVVPEDQIYRVDHFLGRSTVLNLIGLRFANRIMAPIWSAQHIERVEIVYDEDLALEGRAGYYDHAGALRDMLQSHLLQAMAVFAMEPIATIEPHELHDLKAQVLRATRVWDDAPRRSSRRARYTAGELGDRRVPAYVEEHGVDPDRMTETLAQITVEIHNSRWSGVPFTLRSGKAMGRPRKQVIAHFREVPHVPKGFHGSAAADKMVIGLNPGSVDLALTMNAEGDPMDLEQKVLHADLTEGRMQPYGEVLREILDGNPLLTVRGDAAESCWRIVDPVIEAWRDGAVPMEEYAAGSEGPDGW